MSQYWQDYWDSHASKVPPSEPFRQVLRVQNKAPIQPRQFEKLAENIRDRLELTGSEALIDLCAGNGLLTTKLAPYCAEVIAVDFCRDLVDAIPEVPGKRIDRIVGDASKITFPAETTDRVLIAAALQHFSQAEVIRMLQRVSTWLRPGGKLLITDILDQRLIWKFYNSQEREASYFENVASETPILGTWFDRSWLEKLARFAGFTCAESMDQPPDQIYSHYRFDFECNL